MTNQANSKLSRKFAKWFIRISGLGFIQQSFAGGWWGLIIAAFAPISTPVAIALGVTILAIGIAAGIMAVNSYSSSQDKTLAIAPPVVSGVTPSDEKLGDDNGANIAQEQQSGGSETNTQPPKNSCRNNTEILSEPPTPIDNTPVTIQVIRYDNGEVSRFTTTI